MAGGQWSREDDAKAEKREAELVEETRQLIAKLGEAGWQSPFFTGPPQGMFTAYTEEFRQYKLWRSARDLWTQTGDKGYLIELEKHVSWVIPPEPKPAIVPLPRQPHPLVQIGAAVVLATVFLVILMVVSVFLFRH